MNWNGKAEVRLGLVVLASIFLASTVCAQVERNSLAQTPPMGWNSWNKFACNVSEDLIKSVADAMATNGMKDAGYQYVVIDDCWQVSRDENGFIVADPQRLPFRDQGAGGLCALEGIEIWTLLGRRHENLRGTAGQPGA